MGNVCKCKVSEPGRSSSSRSSGKKLKKKKKKQWETSIDRKDIAKKNLR